MFKSKVRPLIVTQYEHSRLAGSLAALWGNRAFDRPAIDFAPFVRGVTLHDWGYGVMDNLPIGEAKEADWLKVMHRGAQHRFDNPITDIVTKLHIRRLLNARPSPGRQELITLIDARVESQLDKSGFGIEAFEWADRITRFCDSVAFDFSFGQPKKGATPVYSRQAAHDEVTITYCIQPGGEICVDPWPFSVSEYSGIVVGYRCEGFPDSLQPDVIRFRLHQSV